MADRLALPPAGATKRLTLDLSARQVPYFDEWHLASRKDDNETLTEFLLRTLTVMSLQRRHSTLLVDDQNERRDASAVEASTRADELSAETDDLAG